MILTRPHRDERSLGSALLPPGENWLHKNYRATELTSKHGFSHTQSHIFYIIDVEL